MSTFLFLLLFFFVLLPLGRIGWAMWRQYRLIKRHMRQAEDFRRAFEQGAQGHYGAPRSEEPSPRKKKIADDVGEYVAFEEVRVYNSEAESAAEADTVRVSAEAQVEDADWEEIK